MLPLSQLLLAIYTGNVQEFPSPLGLLGADTLRAFCKHGKNCKGEKSSHGCFAFCHVSLRRKGRKREEVFCGEKNLVCVPSRQKGQSPSRKKGPLFGAILDPFRFVRAESPALLQEEARIDPPFFRSGQFCDRDGLTPFPPPPPSSCASLIFQMSTPRSLSTRRLQKHRCCCYGFGRGREMLHNPRAPVCVHTTKTWLNSAKPYIDIVVMLLLLLLAPEGTATTTKSQLMFRRRAYQIHPPLFGYQEEEEEEDPAAEGCEVRLAQSKHERPCAL